METLRQKFAYERWQMPRAKSRALAVLGIAAVVFLLVAPKPWADRVVNVIMALTLAALVWYAWETRVMRINAADQTRLLVLPILRMLLQRDASDKVVLDNIGRGIASRALLQGYMYRDDEGQVWRVTFDPVYMVLPGKSSAPFVDITLEQSYLDPLEPHGTVSESGAIVIGTMRRVAQVERPLVLQLYVVDILGHVYKSEVRIGYEHLAVEEQPITLNPVRVASFPDAIVPVELPDGN